MPSYWLKPHSIERQSTIAEALTLQYDRVGDILHINKRPPYAEQESEEVGDEIIARLNPFSGEIENLEILFFSQRLLSSEDILELPIVANLRLRTA